jgi:hypothetical protein
MKVAQYEVLGWRLKKAARPEPVFLAVTQSPLTVGI